MGISTDPVARSESTGALNRKIAYSACVVKALLACANELRNGELTASVKAQEQEGSRLCTNGVFALGNNLSICYPTRVSSTTPVHLACLFSPSKSGA